MDGENVQGIFAVYQPCAEPTFLCVLSMIDSIIGLPTYFRSIHEIKSLRMIMLILVTWLV